MSASCFGVINKDNNEIYDIYDVTYDKAGYPHFLVYKDGQWTRMSAKHFRPMGAESFNELLTKWSNSIYAE